MGISKRKPVFKKVIASIKKDYKITSKTRTYQGFELIELTDKSKKQTFTYLIYENVVAGSFTPFLVEDVVRNISDGFINTFMKQNATLQEVSKLENDEGDIYINFVKLPDLLASFLIEGKANELNKFSNFFGDTFLDIKITDNEILLNGVSTMNLKDNDTFIGTFRNQNPGRNEISKLLPNNTALLYHVTFSDFQEWQSQLTKYWSVKDKNQFERFMDFDETYELNFDWIDGEAANAILETPDKELSDQLIFIGINDKEKAFNELSLFANKISSVVGDSVYMDNYFNQPIVQIPFSEFPSQIMGSYFYGFKNSFATIYNDYLVIGNSMQVVKYFFDELAKEDNWGKSVRQNLFLENTLNESNFSLLINTSLCWQMIMDNLNDDWSAQFKKYENQLKSFDRISIQVSNLDQRFYTSIAVGHEAKKKPPTRLGRLKRLQSAYAMSPLTSKPYIVRNHHNKKFEVLMQDSLNMLYQISNEGDIAWADSINDKIVSKIHQIDYYKNAKLQYLFATKNKIHLLDRNGVYVENFPIKLYKNVELEYLSVIDYDNSKRYRFMAVDKKGNIYLFDKKGKNLKGWKPRSLDGQLVDAGFHIRVKGGDCLIALQKNGMLNVLNRRGEMYPGFPVDLKTQVQGGLFAAIGNDFNGTRLITITDEGEMIEVNLKGKIVRREQLYKPTKESKFWLVNDALKRNYVIARQEYNKITLMNGRGEQLMETNIVSSGNLAVQYYNFSTDNQIFIVVDKVQEFAYIFGKGGRQITFEPLECSQPISLLYSSRQKEYKLYKCFNNIFTIETFK